MGKKRAVQGGVGSKGRSISKRDYKILKQVFIGYDKDSSGTVTYQEFLRALEGEERTATGLTASAAGMFDQMDGDQSGEVSGVTEQRLDMSISAYLSHCAVSERRAHWLCWLLWSLSRSHKLCL